MYNLTTRAWRKRKACSYLALAAMAALTAGAVSAQDVADSSKAPPVLNPETSINGVDMVSGAFSLGSPFSLSAPAAAHLAYHASANGWQWNPAASIYPVLHEETAPSSGYGSEYLVSVTTGSGAASFDCEFIDSTSGYSCIINDDSRGVTLEVTSFNYYAPLNRGDPREYTFTAKDGTVYILKSITMQTGTESRSGNGLPLSITYPSQEKLTYSDWSTGARMVNSNLGYSVNITTPQLLKGATVLSSMTLTKSGSTYTETDALGRTFSTTFGSDTCNSSGTRNHVTSVTQPGGLVTSLTYSTQASKFNTYPVTSLARGGVTWTYTPNFAANTITVSYPMGGSTVVTSNMLGTSTGAGTDCDVSLSKGKVLSVSDPLSRLSQYTYVTTDLVASGTQPEGNGGSYTYDDRGNLLTVTRKRKPGSTDVTDNVVIFQASYDTTSPVGSSSCPLATRKTCNKPNWTKDALGNQTDYTYYSHGGVKTVTLPADASALRKRTYVTFEYYNTGSGSIYRPIRSETCALSSAQLSLTACPTGAGTETTTSVTTTSYGTSTTAPNTYGTFLPYSVTQTDGNTSLSATTTYTYDAWGRVTAVDGPLSGTVDVSYTTYDAVGRKVFEIGVDPDGGGALKRSMVKHTYNADDQETKTETGTGNTTDGSDFVVSSFTRMTYDALGHLTKTEAVQP